MICSHCGKALGNEKLMFCVYCGYPLKGEKKGFFAKSEATGVSRAEKLANDTPAPAAPAPAAPNQPVSAPMQNPQSGSVPPMNGMPQAPMGMQQPMQGMPQMGAQPMMAGMPPQMGYGMPQMGYGMPQMQIGVPQFAGYDAAGNPMYMQMVPQFMGYDAYGNPLYNMVAVPYVMPPMQGMQGMPGMNPMMQQQPAAYPQEKVIDVPQEQIRPAEAVSAAKMQTAPAPAPVAQPRQAAPVPQVPNMPVQPAPKPAANRVPINPIQSVQAATQAAIEALTAFQGVNVVRDAEPVPPAPYRSAQISSVYDLPMDASTLMNEDESRSGMPDEKALLDSIFGKQKNYSMSEGTKPGAATFSINVGANEITSVQGDGFGNPNEAAPPPAQSLFSNSGADVPAPKKKASKPMTEKDANAAKRAAKEAKMREMEAEEAAKSGKEPKGTKKKAVKKPPAKIVSPDEFFEDKPHNGSRSKSMLSVKELDKLDDGQLEAHLSSLGGSTGGKKSNRSMKAASKEEMDLSNVDAEAMVAPGKSRFPN